jgi:hypothetical protein
MPAAGFKPCHSPVSWTLRKHAPNWLPHLPVNAHRNKHGSTLHSTNIPDLPSLLAYCCCLLLIGKFDSSLACKQGKLVATHNISMTILSVASVPARGILGWLGDAVQKQCQQRGSNHVTNQPVGHCGNMHQIGFLTCQSMHTGTNMVLHFFLPTCLTCRLDLRIVVVCCLLASLIPHLPACEANWWQPRTSA